MSLTNATDIFYSKKDKQVLAKLQREKDEREARAETMSTASTLAATSNSPEMADSSKPSTTACGKPHSMNRPCDSPACKGTKLTAGQRLGRKLGFGKAKEVDEGVSEARLRLDGLSGEERARLREETRARKASEQVGVAGGPAMGVNGSF